MIKIRLAIVDKDKNYADKLRFALNTKYENELEVYVFDNIEKALSTLSQIRIDVILFDSQYDISSTDSIEKCSAAYLCSSNDISTIKGKKAICKFQKIDTFYKDILNLYAEKAEGSIEINNSLSKKNIILFVSAAGGVGCSTLCAGYALRKAKHGNTPLYINLEPFGNDSEYFNADGNQTLSDIIYAVKCKKANLPIKIKSAMKKSSQGVIFFDSCTLALDILETKADDYDKLIDALQGIDDFDEIIIDLDLAMSAKDMLLMNKATKIVLVSDGSFTANTKTKKFIQSINIIDEQKNTKLLDKIEIFYNKFSSKNSRQLDDFQSSGGLPVYSGFPDIEIVNKISEVSDIDNI